MAVNSDALLTRLSDGELARLGRAVHGTYHAAWPAIVRAGGLKRMSRAHVHLAPELPGASGVISGMRASAQLEVWVDVLSASAAGIPFFRAANGVILTPGVAAEGRLPIDFFECVVDRKTGKVWRGGGVDEWGEDGTKPGG